MPLKRRPPIQFNSHETRSTAPSDKDPKNKRRDRFRPPHNFPFLLLIDDLLLKSCANSRSGLLPEVPTHGSMSVMDPSTLRDRLRTREDDDGRDAWAGLTLGAVLGCEKRPPPGHINRTLLDIIRDESTGYKDVLGQPNNNNNKMSWKSFKDRLRIRRAGAAWTSSMPIPASDVPTRSQLSRRQSTRVTMYTTDPPEPTETFEESPGTPENPLPVEAVQVHNLRPQFSRNNSIRAPSRTFSRADSTRLHTGVTDGPVVSRRLGGGIEYNCCVCMVRHKGAAFIPCGHTFCRLCSRELWVSRGNCPLCNGFILEILDIF
ncbi:unnamed protein product, partial [Vitis vinifera]